jgi:hypothetical protein
MMKEPYSVIYMNQEIFLIKCRPHSTRWLYAKKDKNRKKRQRTKSFTFCHTHDQAIS